MSKEDSKGMTGFEDQVGKEVDDGTYTLVCAFSTHHQGAVSVCYIKMSYQQKTFPIDLPSGTNCLKVFW